MGTEEGGVVMQLVCITGSHRSGTSAVAGVLRRLGVWFGTDDELLDPGPDNPKGYTERKDVLRVNNQLLRALGGTWDTPALLTPERAKEADLDGLRAKANAAMKALAAGDQAVCAVKDPRFAVLSAFWDTVGTFDRVVVPLRSPVAVVNSLQARNGMAVDRAAYLWVRHVASAVLLTDDPVILDYDGMVDDPAAGARRLASDLGLEEPDDAAIAAIEEFVTPTLRHRPGDHLHGDPRLSLATTLHETLVEGALPLGRLAGLLRFAQLAVEDSVGDPEAATALEARLRDALAQREDLDGQVAELLADQERARRRRAIDDDHAEELRCELQFARARAERLRFELDRASEKESEKESEARAEAALQRALEAAQKDRDHARYQLDRLRGRRSVRFSLQVAALAKPLFRAVRRVRKRRGGPAADTAAQPGPTSRDESGGHGAGADEAERSPAPAPTEEDRARPAAELEEPETEQESSDHDEHGAVMARAAVIEAFQLVRDKPPITIVVPVYNAIDELRRCVTAVRRWTRLPHHLVIVDDASPDPAVAAYLGTLQDVDGITVLTNTSNLGFSGAVNRGLELAEGDAVLLNSDAIVGPLWLRNLVTAAYSGLDIGSVTPVSNNAGAFSVPVRGEDNPLPEGVTVPDVVRRFAQSGVRELPHTPTSNGFCTYLKGEMLEEVGLLDAENFPRGYGEENDHSMRAAALGWRHVIDDRTYVYHAGSASFGSERDALLQAGVQRVRELHPTYRDEVQRFLAAAPMGRVRDRAAAVLDQDASRPRVLSLVHTGGGGVPKFVDDLARADDQHDSWVLQSDGSRLRLYDGAMTDEPVAEWELAVPVTFGMVAHPEYEELLARVLDEYAIEAVRVEHLIHHPLGAAGVCRDMAVPLVVMIHDYYLTCPTIQLIDDEGTFCGGTCTAGLGRCRSDHPWIRDDVPPLKHRYVYRWRSAVDEHVLAVADALVAPSRAAADVFAAAYPDAVDKLQVIEHGLDEARARTPDEEDRSGAPLRVLAVGHLGPHKGIEVMATVAQAEADGDGLFEIHALGTIPDRYRPFLVDHGAYEPGTAVERIAEIDPDLVLHLSPWGETYCYALTESWLAGVPVVGTDVGAIGQRITETGAGWVLPANSPEDLQALLRRLASSPEELRERRAEVATVGVRTLRAAADDHARLVDALIDPPPAPGDD